MKKRIFKYLILNILITYNLISQIENSNFNPDAFDRHLRFLGSDIFEGRGTGTTGENLASRYIALELNQMNLKPIGNNNTFYQYIPMHGSLPLDDSKLQFINDGDTVNLKLNEDYLIYKPGYQTLIQNPIELIFVGYGIMAPEYDYNDYQDIDVNGKVVVYLAGEPHSEDTTFFNGPAPTTYSFAEIKQRTALSRGAKGTIMIPSPIDYFHQEWEKQKISFAFEDVILSYSSARNFSILINPILANSLFEKSAHSLQDIYDMHFSNNMKCFDLNAKILFKGKFSRRDFISSNVVAMLEGSDKKLKDEYIILSAHYDHLGIGPAINGDSIYNGVMDNAMGVAGLIEIAKYLSNSETKLKRSVIFLFVSGEEKGTLGSRYYTDHPIKPLYKTVANINIDGLAFIDNFRKIVGIGSEYSTFSEFMKEVCDSMNLELTSIPEEFRQFASFNLSDQIAFAEVGIPAILTMDYPDFYNIDNNDGINKLIDYSENIYHSPFDDLSQEINLSATFQHLEYIVKLTELLANSEKTIEWNEGVLFNSARLRIKAERR